MKYIPKLYVKKVCWKSTQGAWTIYNTNGASKGNPGEITYGFCMRNKDGELVHAETQ